MAEKFQKMKLNRDDHKKIDDAAKNVKKGGSVLIAVGIVYTVIKKNGPKLVNTAKKIITKA